MKLTGPVLEDEGMHVFEWWGGDYRPLEDLIAEMAEIKKGMKEPVDSPGETVKSQETEGEPECARRYEHEL